MATIRSSDQITITDLTDGYSVSLSLDGYTFPGTTGAARAGEITTTVSALCGSDSVPVSVVKANISCPTGISISKVETSGNNVVITIAVSTSFTQAGVVEIPVVVNNDVTINKAFAASIAFTGTTGNGISSMATTYQAGTSNTTPPTGTWGNTPPSVGEGQYLWTKMVITYTDGSESEPVYSVAKQGKTGATGAAGGKWYSGTGITGTSTTETVYSGSGVSSAVVGDMYLNTSTYNTYRCTVAGAASAAKWVYVNNIKGTKGDDAITMTVTSSAGNIFKNSNISTTLTAHVYKGGSEVTGTALSALGTIKWYKDGSTTALSTTGATLTISAADVTNKATYIAQLEQ